MCLQYVANAYPVRWIRDETPALTVDEIENHLTIRESGWIPDSDDLAQLSEETRPTAFRHTYWKQSLTSQGFYQMIAEKLDRDLPTIAIINAGQLRQGTPTTGPAHAVVVRGLTDTTVAVNDPWGQQVFVARDRFMDAWDAEGINQMVHVEIQEQSTLQEQLPAEDQS
jgi:hypothetical protein